jgi:hypothetical protein
VPAITDPVDMVQIYLAGSFFGAGMKILSIEVEKGRVGIRQPNEAFFKFLTDYFADLFHGVVLY